METAKTHRWIITLLVVALVATAMVVVGCAGNGIPSKPVDVPSPQVTSASRGFSPTAEPESSPTIQGQELSTPQLIEQAFAKGGITAEERLLYLAYAVYEYESLPAEFRSNVGWRGTFIVKEIKEATDSPSVMCVLSPYVQSELRRLLKTGVTYDD